MLVIQKVGNEVYFNEQKLTIVKQASKGPGNEVVKIDGLPGSNGQKWISLSRLVEGKNELNLQGREVSVNVRKYKLTEEEALEVKRLQSLIDEIVETAKSRYVAPVKAFTAKDIENMTLEEKKAKFAEIQKMFGM